MNEPWNDRHFNPGGKIDEIDPRDFQYGEIARALAPFDWAKGYDVEAEIAAAIAQPGFKLKIKDQNGSGSCGGQAWSYQASVLKAIYKKIYDERSAKFIYSQAFVPGGGSAGRTLSDLFVKGGISSEALCPSYDNGQPPSEAFMERAADISTAARTDAKTDEALSYAMVTGSIDDHAQALAANHGNIFLIRGSNNGSWGTFNPKPPVAGDTIWTHWVMGGKAQLVNGVKNIIFPNSWGAAVGQNGWQALDEEYMNAQIPGVGPAVLYGWTHLFNPNPVTTFQHTFNTDLHYGTTSDEVNALQQALQADGSFPAGVTPTNYFGDITAAAVVKFQKKYGINNSSSPLGKDVGPLTRAKLNVLFGE